MSVEELKEALGADVVIPLHEPGRAHSVPEALGLLQWFDDRRAALAEQLWMVGASVREGEELVAAKTAGEAIDRYIRANGPWQDGVVYRVRPADEEDAWPVAATP